MSLTYTAMSGDQIRRSFTILPMSQTDSCERPMTRESLQETGDMFYSSADYEDAPSSLR